MLRSIHPSPTRRFLSMTACCGAILFAASAHAADQETLSAARTCAQKEWADKAGYEKAQAYREVIDCLSALYIRVAAGQKSNAALEKEIAQHLGELEAAYHASRGVCRLQQKLLLEDESCGTHRASPHEFVRILKTMILDADAGLVRRDPALVDALELN